jgi:CRP-like cAMP-binding protein
MRESQPPRHRLELSPDHFHPSYVKQMRGRTAPAPSDSSRNFDNSSIVPVENPAPAARVRVMMKGLLGGSHQALLFTASNAIRAVRWSGRHSASLIEKARQTLVASGRPGSGTLAELAEAGRYCAVSNRLGSVTRLTDDEQISVRYNTPNRRLHQTGSEIAIEGDAAPYPLFIASGWACRTRFARNGRRQIIGFLLPGDAIGLHSTRMSLCHTSVVALTSVETVDANSVLEMAADPSNFPGVGNAIQRLHHQDEQFLVNQIARLANPSREERVAHLLLELHWRLKQAGLASHNEFPMPLSDGEMGDALAIGPKGARSTLNAFRRRNILRYRYGQAEILRPDHLHNMCGFCPPAPESRFRLSPAPDATEPAMLSQPMRLAGH